MTEALTRVYEADGQEIRLSPATITRYVLGGNQQVPEPEMAKAIMTCAARKLNPFAGDVHILPHWDSASGTTKLSVCPSIDFYQRRAMANPRFRGMKDGVTVIANGVMLKKQGCAVYEDLGEKLIGGWAAVYIDGYVDPVCCEVSMAEYDQHRALWKSKPATMINKVAKSQALRKAFPDEFTGLYEPSEMGLEETSTSVTTMEPPMECEATYEEPVEEDKRPAMWAEVADLKKAAISMGTNEQAIRDWMDATITNPDGTPKAPRDYAVEEICLLRDKLHENIADQAELEASAASGAQGELSEYDIDF